MSIDWDDLVLGPVMGIFGEDAAGAGLPVYTPRGLPAFMLADAVFDAQYEQVIVSDDSQTTTSRRPVLGVRLSLFLARPPQQNDTVLIPATGKTYVVRDVQPDGHGHALLLLMEKAS
ncbi:MAG TPA: hypothetical protein VF409_05470 [Sphingomonas sp.]